MNAIVELLISRKYHILRHSLLLAVSLIMAIANFYNEYPFGDHPIVGSLLMAVFLIPIYANVYILVPRLLFRNRFFSYLMMMAAVVFMTILLVICLQLTIG